MNLPEIIVKVVSGLKAPASSSTTRWTVTATLSNKAQKTSHRLRVLIRNGHALFSKPRSDTNRKFASPSSGAPLEVASTPASSFQAESAEDASSFCLGDGTAGASETSLSPALDCGVFVKQAATTEAIEDSDIVSPPTASELKALPDELFLTAATETAEELPFKRDVLQVDDAFLSNEHALVSATISVEVEAALPVSVVDIPESSPSSSCPLSGDTESLLHGAEHATAKEIDSPKIDTSIDQPIRPTSRCEWRNEIQTDKTVAVAPTGEGADQYGGAPPSPVSGSHAMPYPCIDCALRGTGGYADVVASLKSVDLDLAEDTIEADTPLQKENTTAIDTAPPIRRPPGLQRTRSTDDFASRKELLVSITELGDEMVTGLDEAKVAREEAEEWVRSNEVIAERAEAAVKEAHDSAVFADGMLLMEREAHAKTSLELHEAERQLKELVIRADLASNLLTALRSELTAAEEDRQQARSDGRDLAAQNEQLHSELAAMRLELDNTKFTLKSTDANLLKYVKRTEDLTLQLQATEKNTGTDEPTSTHSDGTASAAPSSPTQSSTTGPCPTTPERDSSSLTIETLRELCGLKGTDAHNVQEAVQQTISASATLSEAEAGASAPQMAPPPPTPTTLLPRVNLPPRMAAITPAQAGATPSAPASERPAGLMASIHAPRNSPTVTLQSGESKSPRFPPPSRAPRTAQGFPTQTPPQYERGSPGDSYPRAIRPMSKRSSRTGAIAGEAESLQGRPDNQSYMGGMGGKGNRHRSGRR